MAVRVRPDLPFNNEGKKMEQLIELLKEMGAEDIKYIEEAYCDDQLIFSFNGSTANIMGVHYNDSTGGLCSSVDKTRKEDV